MNNAEQELFTQSDILNMGWTKALINKFLPDPILKQNPMYKSATPMKLWPKDTVLQTMDTPEFKDAAEKAAQRQSAARKAVDTKMENTMNDTEDFVRSVKIKVIDNEKLIRKARDNAFQLYKQRHNNEFTSGKYFFQEADKQTIDRWVVNYIRHNLTEYDAKLFLNRGKVGRIDAAFLLKNLILDRIAEFYPDYKDECIRQKTICEEE